MVEVDGAEVRGHPQVRDEVLQSKGGRQRERVRDMPTTETDHWLLGDRTLADPDNVVGPHNRLMKGP